MKTQLQLLTHTLQRLREAAEYSQQHMRRMQQLGQSPSLPSLPSAPQAMQRRPSTAPLHSAQRASLLLLLLLSALLTPRSSSATVPLSWQTQTTGYTNTSLWMADSTHGVAVGAGGLAQITTDGGLTWSPQYTGSPETLHAVWAADSTHYWAVGTAGTIAFGDGQGWTLQPSGTTETLHAVWGTSLTDIWTVGNAGSIRHWDGSQWTTVTSPTSQALLGISGSSPTDIWAVGNAGSVLHYDGTQWTPHSSSVSTPLQSVRSLGSQAWAAGDSGTILYYDGSTWAAQPSGTTAHLRSIWPLSETEVWVTGDTTTRRWNGSTWANAPRSSNVELVASPSGSLWSCGSNNEIKLWDTPTSTWLTRSYTTGNNLAGIHSPSPGHYLLTGSTSRLDYGNGSSWTRTVQGLAHFEEAWGSSPTSVWVVGSAGSLRHWNGTTLTTHPSGTTQGLFAIWGTDAENIWAVGIAGTILKYNGSTWASQPSGTSATLRDIHGTSPTDLWAVGDAGTILRYNGTSWSPVPSATTSHLYGIWAHSSTEAWVVGVSGLARRWNGSSWTYPGSTGTQQHLTAVHGLDPQNLWIVGAAGTIRYWNGTSFTPQSSGTGTRLSDLYAVSDTDIYIVGEHGSLLHSEPLLQTPSTTSLTADSIQANSATLRASITPNGAVTTAHFQHGSSSSSYTHSSPIVTFVSDQANSPRQLSYTLTGLQPRTTYHYRATATNDAGTTEGADLSFTTANTAPPEPSLASPSIAENSPPGTSLGSLGATMDEDSDPITYTLVSGEGDADNAAFTLSPEAQLLTAASLNYEAQSSYSIRVRAADGFDYSEAILTLSLTDANDPPLALAGSVAASAGVARTLSLSSTDEDQPPQHLSYTITTLPQHGVLADSSIPITTVPHSLSGTLTYTAAADTAATADQLTFSATDGTDSSAPALLSISLHPDTDEDGVPDIDETGDFDGDGIPDNQESNIADLDGDGFIDAYVATLHTVTTTADSGPGSLRQAILDANASPTADGIRFSIPDTDSGHLHYLDNSIPSSLSTAQIQPVSAGGSRDPDWPTSWYRISPTSPLPPLTGPVIISGFTQPGAQVNTTTAPTALDTVLRIELHGSHPGAAGSGLRIHTRQCSIQGLAISGFTSTASYTGAGILIADHNNPTLGSVENASVQGCYIGTDISGSLASGNLYGVYLLGVAQSAHALIGGTQPQQRNLISGNNRLELSLYGTYAKLQGNLIGTERTGTRKLRTVTSVIWLGEDDITIGGTEPGAGNVIAPSLETVHVPDEAKRTRIQGNLIGISPSGQSLITGTQATTYGITPRHAVDALIGGSSPSAGNFIGGTSIGIRISENAQAQRITIRGNTLGLGTDGSTPLANVTAIQVSRGTGHLIGGAADTEGNLICHNTTAILSSGTSTRYAALGNRIHSNATAISLPTERNDPEDTDTGTNSGLNYPILRAAAQEGPDLLIHYGLDAPAGDYLIEFYDNPTTATTGPSFQHGEVYLGSVTLTLSRAGLTTFTTTLPGQTLSAEHHLSATATQLLQLQPVATSEFGGFDSDNDSVPDTADLDDDNDGIPDVLEGHLTDTDGDGIPNRLDLDSDNDSISDLREAGGTDADGDGMMDGSADADGIVGSSLTPVDTDADSIPDYLDLDSDNDSRSDLVEATHSHADTTGNDGLADGTDTDADGIKDSVDTHSHRWGEVQDAPPTEHQSTADTDTLPDYLDLDSDEDGQPDLSENGYADLDLGGTSTISDTTDADADGIADNIDSQQGSYGGLSNRDLDGDNLLNHEDADQDGDGIVNILDPDADADGTPNDQDPDPVGIGTLTDLDGDGATNEEDADLDGDSIPNTTDPDLDGDGVANYFDTEGSGTGTGTDIDADGIPNAADADIDGDGRANLFDPDVDGDGIANADDDDADSDSTPNALDSQPYGIGTSTDIDGDGTANDIDTDIDGDGLLNSEDPDAEGDGIPNTADLDDDNDGTADMADSPLATDSAEEGQNTLLPNPDLDADGIANVFDPDADGDELPNAEDPDADNDGILNEEDPTPNGAGSLEDIDGDGAQNSADPDIDGDDLINLLDPDVDGDGILNNEDTDADADGDDNEIDATPLGIGTASDHDGDGLDNEVDPDVDGDGVVNYFDIDTDGDSIPNTLSSDDDSDAQPDSSDTTPNGIGTQLDLDGDSLANATDPDMDGDGIPNESDPDANGDGLADSENNTAPTALAATLSVVQSVQRTIVLHATDLDVNPSGLTHVITRLPSLGTLRDGSTTLTAELLPRVLTGTLTYQSTPAASGTDSFGFAADDGLSSSEEASITLQIQAPSTQNAWTIEYSGRANHSIHMVSSTQGFVVGARGQIRRTTDGSTWTYEPTTYSADLNGIWATSPSQAWAVGATGSILYFNGTVWATQTSGTSQHLRAVWGSSATDVWAVGDAGTLLHFNGTAWASVSSGTSQNLADIWGTSSSSLWAVGAAGTLLHYNGTTWATQSSGTSTALSSIHGLSASQLWVCGDAGTVLRYNGTTWTTETTSTSASFSSIHVVSPTSIWAIGSSATLYFNGTAWISAPGAPSQEVTGIGSEIWAVGAGDQIKKWVGQSWRTQSYHQSQNLQSVSFTSSAGIIAAHNGRADLWNGSTWVRTASGINTYEDAWHTGTDTAWLVGTSGVIKQLISGSWITQTSGTSQHLYGIWGADPSNVWAVGDGGTILHYDGSTWTPQSSGVAVALRDIQGRTPTDIWAVGEGGTILHYDGTAWTTHASGTTARLNAVWPLDSGEAWAVGAGGIVRRWNGLQWSAQGAPFAVNLNGIRGQHAARIWLVGDSGQLWLWDGTQYLQETSGITMNLMDLAPASPTEIWAVADTGTLLSTRVAPVIFTLPTVTTSAPTSVIPNSAMLNGIVNPNGEPTTARFELGTTPSYGTTLNLTLSQSDATTDQAVTAYVSLDPGTVYYVRLAATNTHGTQYGGSLTFRTPDPNSFDVDGDGIPNVLDTDIDGDGILNGSDSDADADGIANASDPTPHSIGTTEDHDADGISNTQEGSGTADTDSDGAPDSQDLDSDADGLADTTEAGPNLPTLQDTDADFIPDFRDLDSDNDGINDVRESMGTDADNDGQHDPATLISTRDTDSDGVPDHRDLDSDNDTLSDLVESGSSSSSDPDRDGLLEGTDADSDGIHDSADNTDTAFGEVADTTLLDSDSDGTPNVRDLDSDNDNTFDINEAGRGNLDTSPDGRLTLADSAQATDTDGDGISDLVDGDTQHFGGLSPTADSTYTLWRSARSLSGSNTDGDMYPDLIEFAFGLSPQHGGTRHSLRPSEHALPQLTSAANNAVSLQFIRTAGLQGISYELQTAPTLEAGSWVTTPLDSLPPGVSLTATLNADGTESVQLSGLENLPGCSTDHGFLRVQLQNSTPALSAQTLPLGWTRTTLAGRMQTMGSSFIRPALYSGTLLSTTATTLTLSSTMPAGTLSLSRPAYAEITTGPHAGHRLELDQTASSGDSLTLNLSATSNTTATLPAGLAGQSLVLRQHVLLADILPVSKLTTGGLSSGSADQVLLWNGSGFTTYYYLTDGAGTAHWARVGDNTFSNQNSTVLAPGTGLFCKHALTTTSTTTTLLGDVRPHSFRLRLQPGDNLVCPGFPEAQSPTALGMTRSAGFTGTLSLQTADQVIVWRGDAVANTPGYVTYYLAHDGGQTPNEQWTRSGDGTFASQNDALLFQPGRAHFLRVRNAAGALLSIPSPLQAP